MRADTEVQFLFLYFSAIGSFLYVSFFILVYFCALQISAHACDDLSAGKLVKRTGTVSGVVMSEVRLSVNS